MSYKDDYKNQNTEAPFYWLINIIMNYCHPEAAGFDDLVEDLSYRGPWTIKFKEQHRAALLDPSQLPDGAIAWASSYGDGDQLRYLRRLWRDLYPGEPVPGGDDEFREDLRKLIHGETDKLYATTASYYDDRPPKTKTNDVEELKELGRRIWKRFYPDEPLP